MYGYTGGAIVLETGSGEIRFGADLEPAEAKAVAQELEGLIGVRRESEE